MSTMKQFRLIGLFSGLGAGIGYLASTARSRNEISKGNTSVLANARSTASELTTRCMLKYGAPGCVVAVSVDGHMVWSEGFGLSDVENNTPCTPSTVMRIASISKSLTAVAAAKLWEQGQLDLDKAVQAYVSYFPEKKFENQPVTITTRQLLSHLGCVRHYKKLNQKKLKGEGDGRYPEFYSAKPYRSVSDALKLFSADDLMCNPGSKYLYTTHGWTLISAVIEAASGMSYLKYMQDTIFEPLGLKSVMADRHAPLITSRAKQYRMSNKTLENAPFVDNSLKWAGGGLLSNSEDLVTFGNALLKMYQNTSSETIMSSGNLANQPSVQPPHAILKSSTVDKMWTPVVETNMKSHQYAWGWFVNSQGSALNSNQNQSSPFEVMHTGGAMGGSSILLIRPNSTGSVGNSSDLAASGHMTCSNTRPCGIVVAILFNLNGVQDVHKLASSIADVFTR